MEPKEIIQSLIAVITIQQTIIKNYQKAIMSNNIEYQIEMNAINQRLIDQASEKTEAILVLIPE